MVMLEKGKTQQLSKQTVREKIKQLLSQTRTQLKGQVRKPEKGTCCSTVPPPEYGHSELSFLHFTVKHELYPHANDHAWSWLINAAIWGSLILTRWLDLPFTPVASLWGSPTMFCCGLNIFGWSHENFAADQLMWVTKWFYVNPSKGGSSCILFSPQVRTWGFSYHLMAHWRCRELVFEYSFTPLTASDLSLPWIHTWLLYNGKLKTLFFFFYQIDLNLIL